MQTIRRNIAYTLVGVWGTSIILILFLMIFKLLDLTEGQEILKTFSSVTSGFVGMVLGFYFTRSDNENVKSGENSGSAREDDEGNHS
tara:strand:+ start:582 stop:842 length:261 start_codon:yes stop_codon:yes gene_type:complete